MNITFEQKHEGLEFTVLASIEYSDFPQEVDVKEFAIYYDKKDFTPYLRSDLIDTFLKYIGSYAETLNKNSY